MKKFLFLLGLLFLFPLSVLAEQINDFNTQININKNATIKVTEKIVYDFGSVEKHGIYRDLPVGAGFFRELPILVRSVSDEGGQGYHFVVNKQAGSLQIKIGDADKLISGVHTYVIVYDVGDVLNFFKDHDELYWNSVGTGWQVPIENVTTRILLPDGLSLTNVSSTCFQGVSGSTNNCDSKNEVFRSITFTTNVLAPGEGQTVVVGFPKGYFAEPTFWQRYWQPQYVQALLFILLPILVFCIMFYLWYTRGRDPKGQGTIITQFDIPDNLTAVEVGTIIDHKMEPRDLSAQIVELAIKGYLKITRLEGHFLKKDDYLLKRLKKGDDLPNEFEQKLLHALMVDAVDEEIKLSSLKNKFYADYNLIKKSVYDSLIKKDYYKSNPELTILVYAAVAILVSSIGVYAVKFSWMFLASCIFSSGVICLFGLFMPVRTKKGVAAREYILGLKNYLTVAEKDRLEFHNAPEKNPETFEKFLSVAIALRVEKSWAKQFEGIYETNPSWYNGSNQPFNSILLVDSLSNFSAATTGVMSKASSGGSGFSGGGAGGGFGGGGGGSW